MHTGVPSHPAGRALIVQVMLVVLAAAAILAPPANGSMAIVPLLPGDPSTSWRWAIGADALMIAPGRYPGSIVVRGSFAKLFVPALAHGAILISAKYAGCSADQPKERS